MPALHARGIGKRFGPVIALDGVDLELRAGEVTALMGENGAGKSTLLKILTGDYQPDERQLLMDGREVTFADPSDSRAAGLRVIAQEPEIVPHVSVAENIYVGAISKAGLFFDQRGLEKRAAERPRPVRIRPGDFRENPRQGSLARPTADRRDHARRHRRTPGHLLRRTHLLAR